MSSKDKVLELLHKNGGGFLSGEEIAQGLGLSRNSVWKAIQALRKSGYEIEAVTNRGYRLHAAPDELSVSGVSGYLPAGIDCSLIEVFKTLESTNKTAKEKAINGAPHGTVVISECQTSGNAHHGKRFFSPSGGIYLSVIIRPERYPFSDARTIVACAAEAVVETVRERTGKQAEIHGVNDVCVNGRKISGILTESVSDFEMGDVQWIVIGIGINYQIPPETIPESLRGKIGSIYEAEASKTGRSGADQENAGNGKRLSKISRNEFAAAIIEKLLLELPEKGKAQILSAYERDRV